MSRPATIALALVVGVAGLLIGLWLASDRTTSIPEEDAAAAPPPPSSAPTSAPVPTTLPPGTSPGTSPASTQPPVTEPPGPGPDVAAVPGRDVPIVWLRQSGSAPVPFDKVAELFNGVGIIIQRGFGGEQQAQVREAEELGMVAMLIAYWGPQWVDDPASVRARATSVADQIVAFRLAGGTNVYGWKAADELNIARIHLKTVDDVLGYIEDAVGPLRAAEEAAGLSPLPVFAHGRFEAESWGPEGWDRIWEQGLVSGFMFQQEPPGSSAEVEAWKSRYPGAIIIPHAASTGFGFVDDTFAATGIDAASHVDAFILDPLRGGADGVHTWLGFSAAGERKFWDAPGFDDNELTQAIRSARDEWGW